MMRWALLIVILTTGAAAACRFDTGGSNRAFPAQGTPIDDLEIRLERTPCFGTCPEYELTILKDGTVRFVGKSNTAEREGTWKIEPEKVQRLIDEFKRANYFDLEDKYTFDSCPTAATDMSTVNTSIRINGRSKSISHYLGCSSDDRDLKPYPPGLSDLERAIDEITESRRWVEMKRMTVPK